MGDVLVSVLLDAILVGLMAFIIIRYSIRGFVKSFLSVVKILFAPFIALLFASPFGKLISAWLLEGPMTNWMKNMFLERAFQENGQTFYELHKFTDDGVSRFLVINLLKVGEDNKSGIALVNKHMIGDNPVPATYSEVEQISEFLGSIVAFLISLVIAFIIVFVVTEGIILLLSKLINKLLRKAITIKRLDILLGAIIGIFVSVLAVWILSFVIGKLFDLGNHHYPGVFKEEYVDKTLFLRFFVDNDLWHFIKKILFK